MDVVHHRSMTLCRRHLNASLTVMPQLRRERRERTRPSSPRTRVEQRSGCGRVRATFLLSLPRLTASLLRRPQETLEREHLWELFWRDTTQKIAALAAMVFVLWLLYSRYRQLRGGSTLTRESAKASARLPLPPHATTAHTHRRPLHLCFACSSAPATRRPTRRI